MKKENNVIVYTDEEKEKIVSLYAQGFSTREIARRINCKYFHIRHLLKKLNYLRTEKNKLYLKKCKVCNKPFWTFNIKTKYCHDPCRSSYIEGSDRQQKAISNFYVKVIRSEFWRIVNSNPQEALDFEQQIKDEEGEEFRKLVLGDITKSEKFKRRLNIYNKYKKVFRGEKDEGRRTKTT